MNQNINSLPKKFKNIFYISAIIVALLLMVSLLITYSAGIMTFRGSFLSVETFFIFFLDVVQITKGTWLVCLVKAALAVTYVVFYVKIVINLIKSITRAFSLITKENRDKIPSIANYIMHCNENIFSGTCCFIFITSMLYYSKVSKGMIILYAVALPIIMLARIFRICLISKAPKTFKYFGLKSVESLIVFAVLCFGYAIVASPALYNGLNGLKYFWTYLTSDSMSVVVLLKIAAEYIMKPIISIASIIFFCSVLDIIVQEPERLDSEELFIKSAIWGGVGFGATCIVDALYTYRYASQSFNTSELVIEWIVDQSAFYVPLCLVAIAGIIATRYPPVWSKKKQDAVQPVQKDEKLN